MILNATCKHGAFVQGFVRAGHRVLKDRLREFDLSESSIEVPDLLLCLIPPIGGKGSVRGHDVSDLTQREPASWRRSISATCLTAEVL